MQEQKSTTSTDITNLTQIIDDLINHIENHKKMNQDFHERKLKELQESANKWAKFKEMSGYSKEEDFQKFFDLFNSTSTILNSLKNLVEANSEFVLQLKGQMSFVSSAIGGPRQIVGTIVDVVGDVLNVWKISSSLENIPEDTNGAIRLMCQKHNQKIYDDVASLFDKVPLSPQQIEILINGKGDSDVLTEFKEENGLIASNYIDSIMGIDTSENLADQIMNIEEQIVLAKTELGDAEDAEEKKNLKEKIKQLQEQKQALKATELKAKNFEKDFPRNVTAYLRLIHSAMSVPLKKYLNPIQKKTAQIAIIGSSKTFIPTIEKFNKHVGLLTKGET